jgi:8-oxo-dGTP diphosphatase
MTDKPQKITACAFLHKDGKLFIAKRADTKEFLPGKFELPGGHIEYGEEIAEGLRREFREEFNLEIIVGDPIYAFTYLRDGNHVVEIDYLAKMSDPNAEITLKPEEHSEYRWVDKNQLDNVWDKNDPEYIAIQKGFESIGLS